MAMDYECIISEAKELTNTFTISYDVDNHSMEKFSSTYDELSGWVRKTLKVIEINECSGKESDLYKYIRRFRGRSGDINLEVMEQIIYQLQHLKNNAL
jgi:hypothetical protein